MTHSRQYFLGIFSKVMVVIYVLLGILLLVLPQISFSLGGSIYVIAGMSRIVFGLFLLIYGIYRGYVLFQKTGAKREFRNHVPMLVIVLTTLFSSCNVNSNQSDEWSDSDTIVVFADETFKPIMQSGYEVFMSMDTLSDMQINFVPENIAIKNLVEGKATLAIASRQLTKNEILIINSRALYPRMTKIATDAIAVITHRSNPDSVLSVKEIRQILTGEVNNWNQLGKKQKNLPINVIFDNNESGIVRFMVDSLCKGQKLNAKAYAMTYNNDVIDYVSKHEDAVGFIGASWISDPNDTLHLSFHKMIQVMAICEGDDKTAEDCYKPYQAYLLDQMYPFTRDIYMLNAEAKNGKATRFTNFMAGDKGQRIILKSGILPAVAPTRMIHVSNSF